MEGTWAFNWVQILRHQMKPAVFLMGLISLVAISGMTNLKAMHVDVIGVAISSLLLMSLVTVKLMDSFKTGLLLFSFGLYLLFLLIGMTNLFSLSSESIVLFGWVVVLIMLMTNLIHLFTTLLREMARGLHQYDAIAEAIRLNATPILVSNLSTLLGFVAVAWFDEHYWVLAEVVVIGWLLVGFVLLVAVPLILMNWLLEFRVGHYEDRHGLLLIADFLQIRPRATRAIVLVGLVLLSLAIGVFVQSLDYYLPVVVMLFGSGIFLMLVWRNLGYTVIVLLVCLVSVLLAYGVTEQLENIDFAWLGMGMVIPLGIVLDDGIHFFTRVKKAKSGFFRDNLSVIRFTLSSVGRAILNTSILVVAGLSILLLLDNPMISQLSFLTILTVFIASCIILIILPAAYISKRL